MPPPILPSDVVVGLLTENTASMVAQAVRLVRSIRWFGGTLSGSRVVVCTVGELEPASRQALVGLGAGLRVVSRFHPANPTANRHQLIAELLDAPEALLLLLDCDTIVVQDPLPYLDLANFQAKIASTPTVNDEVFTRLFAHFAIPKPPLSYVTPLDATPTIPYFNAGVMAIPRELARRLAPVWRRYNLALIERPELAAPCQRHMHQASLSLALAESAIPCRELPVAMNFQLNATQVKSPPGLAETDPVVVHYHHLATDDGYLLPCPYPAAQARIDAFHERLRAEGIERRPVVKPDAAVSRPVVVAGMHRSGTSLVAQMVSALGVYAGRPDELTPGDMFNPTGFWELGDAVRLDEEMLAKLGASVTDCAAADVSRLPEESRTAFLARAVAISDRLRGHGAFVLKDPRISLLLPFWREALGEPVCVIVWRHPMAVARSLETRDRLSPLWALALWEHYNRALLRDSEGLPRVLVSYEEMLAEPERVVRELHAKLAALGVEGLTLPGRDAILQIVNDDFNRSGRDVADGEEMLSADQRALLAALRSGAAISGPVAPASPQTLALISEQARLHALAREQTVALLVRDELLRSVFASRSWRLGHFITRLLGGFRRDTISAEKRWKKLKGE
jgi:hypothetical protein